MDLPKWLYLTCKRGDIKPYLRHFDRNGILQKRDSNNMIVIISSAKSLVHNINIRSIEFIIQHSQILQRGTIAMKQ